MVRDAKRARDGRTVIPLSRHDPASIARLRQWVLDTLAGFRAGTHVTVDPGPMAPHAHADGTVHVH
jgi:urease accessory protein